jgi:hypothetical protein
MNAISLIGQSGQVQSFFDHFVPDPNLHLSKLTDAPNWGDD